MEGEVMEYEHQKFDLVNESVDYDDIYGDLSPKHALFVDYYIKYGMNGGRAYKQVYPNVTEGSAYSGSTRLLAEPSINQAIIKLNNYLTKNMKIKDLPDTLQDLSLLTKSSDEKVRAASIYKLADINLKLFQIQLDVEREMRERAEKSTTMGNITFEFMPATEFLKKHNTEGETDS